MKNLVKLLIRFVSIVSGNTQNEQNGYFNNKVTSFGQTKNTEIVYPYGMKAKPPTHTRCLSFLGNANEDTTISIPVMPGNGKIPNVSDGEVIFGNPSTGNYIIMNNSGISMFGNITINGKVEITKDVTALDCKTTSGISLKDHVHAQPDPTIPIGTGNYKDSSGNAVTGDSGKPVVIP